MSFFDMFDSPGSQVTRPRTRSLFRRRLFVLLAGAIGSAACSTEVVKIDDDDGAGGSDGGGVTTVSQGGFGNHGPDGWETTQCFDWPPHGTGAGGFGGHSGGAGGFGGESGPGGDTGEVGGSGPHEPTCPTQEEAYSYIDTQICNGTIISDGTFADGRCCYTVYEECGVGRPFLDEQGRAVIAGRARTKGWSDHGAAPAVGALSADERQALATRWQRDAFLEHASVASFGRFALELLAVGAPSALIEAAHAAALDEVRHARRCFDLARSYGAEDVDAGPMDLGGAVAVSSDLADIARRAVIEGCVGETLASAVAAEQLRLATDPVVREALTMIAEDEARHAELAWRAVAWLVERGGDPVRAAVREAFATAIARIDDRPSKRHAVVEDHGLMSSERERATVYETIAHVIAPLAARLS